MSKTRWVQAPLRDGVPSYRILAKEIEKSPQDDRQYRMIELQNGLKATLVHDSKADKAAASMDVAVGHLSDPDDMPGLAHFTEHLLFLGTEQFPRENEYKEFLAKNNGRSNAYTSTCNTNYYFSVGSTALEGALSRFAAFFHSPLFNPSCTSRELHAVNSENKKNLQIDSRRIFQLGKHLSRPGHPWHKFGTGNLETLLKAAKEAVAARADSTSEGSTPEENQEDGGPAGRESRRRLIEWWKKEYSASRMRLAVIGQEPLDHLADLVARLFSPVSGDTNAPAPCISEHPMGAQELGTFVRVQTIKKYQSLEISFPLEYQPPHWVYKPASFLSHFLGHEGPGSLFSYLKAHGWITSLSAGPQSMAREFAWFKMSIILTEKGFRHYKDILLVAFKYLYLLRNSEFDAYHQSELSIISQTNFRFSEKGSESSYAQGISVNSSMPYPEELILSAPRLIKDWDSETCSGAIKVSEYLQIFTPGNSRVFLMGKKDMHDTLDYTPQHWETEPWYGTQYHVEKLEDEILSVHDKPNDISELFLPGPNEFIPTNFEIDRHTVEEPSKRPFLVRQTPLSILWHKKDDQFWVPRGNLTVFLRSPIANSSAKASVLKRLYVSLVNDALEEYSYDADLAGLRYDFGEMMTGTYIEVFGYNDKLHLLLSRILEHIKSTQFVAERLPVMKEKAKRAWENFPLSSPYSLSDYYASYTMTQTQWTPEEKLAELEAITMVDIQAFVKDLLSQVQLRILVNGNLDSPAAIRIAETVETGLGVSDLPPEDLDQKTLLLPHGVNHLYTFRNQNPDEVNSALSYYLHFGPVIDQRLRVVASLLVQILSEPAFSTLRTKEQLGYIVFCSSWMLHCSKQKGMRIAVQSEKHPVYLEERVESFLASMKEYIEDLDEATFLEQKAGLKKKWTEKDKKLSEESARFEAMVGNGQWDFLRGWNDATVLDEVHKSEVLDLFMRSVHPSSMTRSKLSVHAVSHKWVKDEPDLPKDATVLSHLKGFKDGLEVASSPGPRVEWGDLALSKL